MIAKPPAGLGKAGRAFWRAVAGAVALDDRDQVLMLEAGRVKDRLDALDAVIKRDGPMLPDGRVHPALVEARQQQQTLARLIVAMRLPEDLSDPDSRRPQRRGVRGTYHPRHLSIVEREAL